MVVRFLKLTNCLENYNAVSESTHLLKPAAYRG